ncbi:MAG: hypothetical protein V2J51_13365 [Erythrobacter sp.]|jgi:hypothetical protein|nr:hypothetical protein [Erythrobacter sp.]
MAKKRVVVKGGGENLYYVSESSGTYYVYKGSVWGSDTQIGKARSMSDALAIITSYSGRAIESIG